jgi:hypothetical protein
LQQGFDKPVLSRVEGLSPNGLKLPRLATEFPLAALSLSKCNRFGLTHEPRSGRAFGIRARRRSRSAILGAGGTVCYDGRWRLGVA